MDYPTGYTTQYYNSHTGLSTTLKVTGAADLNYGCHAAQCDPTCYTCRNDPKSVAHHAKSHQQCTSCRQGWYLVDTDGTNAY